MLFFGSGSIVMPVQLKTPHFLWATSSIGKKSPQPFPEHANLHAYKPEQGEVGEQRCGSSQVRSYVVPVWPLMYLNTYGVETQDKKK